MRWTTMGLSAGTQLAAETLAANTKAALAADPPSKPIDWKKRIASVWIPAILGLGLLMASSYVGVRIVAGKSQTPPPAIAKQAPFRMIVSVDQPAQPDPLKAAPKAALQTTTSADFTIISPQRGERYLQVAAVSPHMVLTYVDTLRKTNLDAVVAPGPTPDLLRVLVGPFSDRDSMDQAKAQLVTSGRSPIIRSY
jgi:cell division septation protein DedD